MSQQNGTFICHGAWKPVFIALLPKIERATGTAFRHLKGADYDEALQESSVQAFISFVSLMQRGRAKAVYPGTLARYAIRRVGDGRCAGGQVNSYDVLSPYARQRQPITVQRHDNVSSSSLRWLETVIEDRRTPVPDQVCFRIDYPSWLSQLSIQHRRIAEFLAEGNSTGFAARHFGISAARVSQIRAELRDSWSAFQSQTADDAHVLDYSITKQGITKP